MVGGGCVVLLLFSGKGRGGERGDFCLFVVVVVGGGEEEEPPVVRGIGSSYRQRWVGVGPDCLSQRRKSSLSLQGEPQRYPELFFFATKKRRAHRLAAPRKRDRQGAVSQSAQAVGSALSYHGRIDKAGQPRKAPYGPSAARPVQAQFSRWGKSSQWVVGGSPVHRILTLRGSTCVNPGEPWYPQSTCFVH